ncbi:hypothetical protein DFP72DRAFT_1137168, partial [Ephemerocybe angulata]
MPLSMQRPACGTRIKYANSVGTVRYVGPVENTSGTWLGIEWDDSDRGKHDGAKDGKRYFSCRFPTAGSFIRPSSNVRSGISFLEALSEKYIDQLHGTSSQETVVLGSSLGSIQVEAVGLDKVRSNLSRLERLKVVSLDGTRVAFPDAQGRIRDTCPNIRGLDLSLTLVSSWASVAQIASELPLLQQLSLNRNRFLSLERDGAFSNSFLNLTEIQLNGTLLTWREANGIIRQMPSLRVLELGYNALSSLSTGGSEERNTHPLLHTLNLDNNKLVDWIDVASSISIFPSMETVVLSANGFSMIPPPAPNASLPNIKHLSVSSNSLGSWRDLENLSEWCPYLENLSGQDTPLNAAKPQSRSLVIARFPRLLRLDGTAISERERRDAEILYLTQLAREGAVRADDISKPFRWDELCDKHGPPTEEVKPKEEKLSSQLITILVGSINSPPVQRSIEVHDEKPLSVLPTMILRNLRNKIKKLHGSARGKVELWIRMRDNAWAELSKDDDSSTLDWLGLENDSHI